MIAAKWLRAQKELLAQTKPGPARDTLAAEIDAAEKANADARAKHLRAGGPGGVDSVQCIHCERWAYAGRPIVHSSRCDEEHSATMEREKRCPLHLDGCPADCDYWQRSRAVDAKAARGDCTVIACTRHTSPPSQLCEPCSMASPQRNMHEAVEDTDG